MGCRTKLPAALALTGAVLLALGARPARAGDERREEEAPPLGRSSPLRVDVEHPEPVTVEAGTPLHGSPDPLAPQVGLVDVTVELVPLERHGDWVRVRFGDRIGWAAPPVPPAADEAPPADPDPAPAAAPAAAPRAPPRPDPERLERALELLSAPSEPRRLGPFRLYSDVADRRTLAACAAAAERLPEAYALRYGLTAGGEADFAVVLYRSEEAYRRFESGLGELADLRAMGHAGSGIAALFAEERSADQVTSLLVHELAHLLNRTVLPPLPPPWLEEGIANDLAFSRVRRDGRLELGTLGGKAFVVELPGRPDRFGRRPFSGTLHLEGPIASLNLLQKRLAADALTPLPILVDLTWREFVAPEGRELRYVQSTFLLRYLLDDLDGEGFRGYLASLAGGGPADGASLLAHLGTDWRRLERAWRSWVRRQTG